jgi:hypothetical protein
VVRYSRARQMLDIGNTKLHELLNDGVLERVQIGPRGKRITVESIERAIASGGSPTKRAPPPRRRKLEPTDTDKAVEPGSSPATQEARADRTTP